MIKSCLTVEKPFELFSADMVVDIVLVFDGIISDLGELRRDNNIFAQTLTCL